MSRIRALSASQSLGGSRHVEAALPFVAFTVTWVISRSLYPALGAALGVAAVLALVRLAQRQSLRYVLTAVFPTAIAAFVATRTGRAEDVFLPGILYNGALAAVLSRWRASPWWASYRVRGSEPTGWAKDAVWCGCRPATLGLAVPTLRFVISFRFLQSVSGGGVQ